MAIAKKAMTNLLTLFSFTLFNIFLFSNQGFWIFSLKASLGFFPGQAGLYRPIYSASTHFALLGRLTPVPSAKSPRSGLGIWSQRTFFPGFPVRITFKIITARDDRRDPGANEVWAPDLSERTQPSG
jgi:hypothetical protein